MSTGEKRMFKSGRAYFDGYGNIIHLRDHGNPRWPFTDGTRYFDVNGRFSGDNRNLDLLRPVGPVVTETVTKTRIVPGVYDGVAVGGHDAGKLHVLWDREMWTADELDAAAAVLSALAKGLRDVD